MNLPDNIDINKLPGIIMYLMAASYMKQPVGSWAYKKAKEEHPEYFVEELEQERKWNLVPEEVKNAYSSEISSVTAEIYKECSVAAGGGGILYWLDHPFEMAEFDKCIRSKRSEVERVEKEIHDKYLAAYGIEYNFK